MRFSHLLVGLACLAVASPTPIDPVVNAYALSPKGLVVYAQDSFQGQSYKIDAVNRCFKLDSPVYKNIHSYHVTDMVCNFMSTDECTENTLVTTDASGTDIWGHVDATDAEKNSDKITSVYCGDGDLDLGAAADVDFTKRDENTNLHALGGPGDVHTHDSTAYSPLRVCHDVYLGGVCYDCTLSDKCKGNPFGADAIESLSLDRGYVCAMYATVDCNPSRGLPHYVDATRESVQINDVQYEVWSMICSSSSWKEKTRTTRDSSMYRPGDTTICNGPDFQDCTDNQNAMDRCSSFNPAAGGPTSLKQYVGAVCKWFRGYGCSRESHDNNPVKIDSRAGFVQLPGLGVDNNLYRSVKCKGVDW